MLDRLEQAGFLRRVRDDHDRRCVTLQPQPDKVQAMYADYAEVGRRTNNLATSFSDAELDTVARYLETVIAATEPSRWPTP